LPIVVKKLITNRRERQVSTIPLRMSVCFQPTP
jgi:hypothetical protein